MLVRSNVLFPLLVSFSLSAALTAQVTRNRDIPLKNWPAPLYWQPSPAETEISRAQSEIAPLAQSHHTRGSSGLRSHDAVPRRRYAQQLHC